MCVCFYACSSLRWPQRAWCACRHRRDHFFAMPLTPLLLAVCDGWLVGCLPVCLPICLGCSGGALLITSSSIVLLAKRTNAQPYVFHSFFYIHFEVLFFYILVDGTTANSSPLFVKVPCLFFGNLQIYGIPTRIPNLKFFKVFIFKISPFTARELALGSGLSVSTYLFFLNII